MIKMTPLMKDLLDSALAGGAKPASAVPVVTSPAAVASAVRAATGRPIGRLPIRPRLHRRWRDDRRLRYLA